MDPDKETSDQVNDDKATPAPSNNSKVTEQMIKGINSDDLNRRHESTLEIRKLLSVEVKPPIDEVIASGVAPKLVEFLQPVDTEAAEKNQLETIQFEAAWAVTNIASGTSAQTEYVVSLGAVDSFVGLLSSPNEEVREQAVWALGNIAGDSPSLRDTCLRAGILPPLLAILDGEPKISMTRNVAWVLSNLFRFKPQPRLEDVTPALPTMVDKLMGHGDHEVMADTVWALSYLSDGPNDRIQALLDSGAHKKIVELLNHDNLAIVTPALRTAGNIATGDDTQTQSIVDCGVLKNMHKLLSTGKESIKKESCWTISNITAGTVDQIQAVIDEDLFPAIIQLLDKATFMTKKEAAWAVANVTSGGGKKEQVDYLVNCGCMPPMCKLLSVIDPKIIEVALEFLENSLKLETAAAGDNKDGDNSYRYKIEECGGFERLKRLGSDGNAAIQARATNILQTYFAEKEKADDAEQQPVEE